MKYRNITLLDGEIKRRVKIPEWALSKSTCTQANQVSTGIFETDTYISPTGIVVARRFSCWDNGKGQQEGTFYVRITDPIRLAEEFGIEPKEVPTL